MSRALCDMTVYRNDSGQVTFDPDPASYDAYEEPCEVTAAGEYLFTWDDETGWTLMCARHAHRYREHIHRGRSWKYPRRKKSPATLKGYYCPVICKDYHNGYYDLIAFSHHFSRFPDAVAGIPFGHAGHSLELSDRSWWNRCRMHDGGTVEARRIRSYNRWVQKPQHPGPVEVIDLSQLTKGARNG